MDCEMAQEAVFGALDVGLGSRREAALDRHMESCSACRGRLGRTAEVWMAVNEATAPAPTEARWRRIEDGIARATKAGGRLETTT